jgi:phage shock protein A
MAIISRLTRLLRADVHAVLDRIEEPDALLRQALREMEDEVAENARQLRAGDVEREQLQARRHAISTAQQELAAPLDLCFESDNDALARTLLRRRLEGERMLQRLDQRLADLQRLLAERGTQLDDQRRRLESLRARAELVGCASPRSEDRGAGGGFDEVAVSDADVEIAFLREQQRRRMP